MNSAPKFFRIGYSDRVYLECAWRDESVAEAYASVYDRGQLEIAVEGGLKWPSVISNIKGILILQKEISEEMGALGLSGLTEIYPVKLRKGWGSKIHQQRLHEAPTYVWIRIRRDILIDPDFLKWPRSEAYSNPDTPYRMVPLAGSHGQSDVFGVRGQPWRSLFCTRRFVEAARENRWRGFEFCPMDVPAPLRAKHVIDYLGKTWPPKSWYPSGIDGHPNNLEVV